MQKKKKKKATTQFEVFSKLCNIKHTLSKADSHKE